MPETLLACASASRRTTRRGWSCPPARCCPDSCRSEFCFSGLSSSFFWWHDRGDFVWDLANHVRSYFDHKNTYYFSDAHFVDQSLPTNIFNFHVDIHSICDLNFHSSKNLTSKTSSFLQVRNKIEKSIINKYQSYYYLLEKEKINFN